LPEDTKEEGKKGGLDMKIIIIGLVAFLLAIAGSYFVARSVLAPLMPKEETKSESKGTGTLIDLGEFTVNISDVSATRFLKTEVVLETNDSKLQKEVEESLSPVIRDEIITILSSKTVADLDVHNRDELKNEIKTRLNRRLGNKITNVYFDTFIMQ
jgi:flagellar FliL protein